MKLYCAMLAVLMLVSAQLAFGALPDTPSATDAASSPSPSAPEGRSFYISPSGDDANDGLAPETAWKTIARATRGEYEAGDRIMFEGGHTFSGSLGLAAENARGTEDAPITITSYGEGRAAISSAVAGLTVSNTGGVRVENIDFRGPNPTSVSWGIGILSESPTAVSGIHIADVEITGYGYGIYAATGEIPAKIRGLRIERLHAHHNALGMSLFGHYGTPAVASGGDYAFDDVYIGHCDLSYNTGFGLSNFGAGLTMMNLQNATVEHCVVHDNGGDNLPPGAPPNGPCAITVYDGHKVVLQHNEIYHQRLDPDGPTDNGGIDIWATDSFVQYNYVHDNEGWGMTLGGGDTTRSDETFGWPSERMVIRYNVFENNGRRLPDSESIPELCSAQFLMFGTLKDFDVYNNTFYSGTPANPVIPGIEQGMISIISTPPATLPDGLRFRNNIFIAGDLVRFVDANLVVNASFVNNAYIGGPSENAIMWGWASYFESVAAWSEATGQERLDGEPAAKIAGRDALRSPGAGGTLNPKPLSSLAAYRLPSGSPLIDAGLDLRARFDLDAGGRDFFGNPIPSGAAFDLGAHERQRGADPSAGAH